MAPASEEVNHAALLADIKATLYEVGKSDLANVSIGDAFESLLHAASRNGVHNPSEFFLLTRAFVLLESLVSVLAPDHKYMESFREEISRLIAKHFSLTQISKQRDRRWQVRRSKTLLPPRTLPQYLSSEAEIALPSGSTCRR
jgi:ubiquinone biosynthesis protein